MSANCTFDLNNYSCNSGLILPLINEYTWHTNVRIIVYLIGLIWCFMGIAIIADVFMCSIETITSKTRKLSFVDPDTGKDKEIEVKVWNDTVANLTLMALGSSAPEILLSIIEILQDKFIAGSLGPGTIVGSAAFNLLVITAICVISVGEEGKKLYVFNVFLVTAFFSLFAYIWLIIILVGISADYVDLWESIVTLLFFPIIVIIAFVVDKNCFRKTRVGGSKESLGMGLDPDQESGTGEVLLHEYVKILSKDPSLTEGEIQKMAAKKFLDVKTHSRAWYRVNATRHMFGGKRITIILDDKLQDKLDGIGERSAASVTSLKGRRDSYIHDNVSVIEFTASSCAVLESEQKVRIGIQRRGNTENRVPYHIETIDGTATKGEDYVEYKEARVFEPGETDHFINIAIIDDNEWEPDEIFFVKLSLDSGFEQIAAIGTRGINQVTIINDDEPGTFEFGNASFLFKESAGAADLPVLRLNGADGNAWVEYVCEDMTAKAGIHFEASSGKLNFAHGEIAKVVSIPIFVDSVKAPDSNFRVRLTKCSEGAKMGKLLNTVVTIVNDHEYQAFVDRMMMAAHMDLDAVRLDKGTWKEQFKKAMNVNGGEVDDASTTDYIMHFITFGWKVLFALVPPPNILGGWLSFVVSLGMIALVTAFVGDLAKIFGCLIGLDNGVTAITFVALGTSLPDLFASRQAAMCDKYADNAIGNVTGSNAVNVFLGLGIPWFMAAVYHTVKGESFNVKSGNLVFSVILYTCTAVVCLSILMIRRAFLPGELGGPNVSKYISGGIMIGLWFVYVIIASLQTYKIIDVTI